MPTSGGFLLLAFATVAASAINPLAVGSPPLAKRAAATRLPVLANFLVAGQVEANGGRVWVANPLDAFRPSDQRLYMDWLAGAPGGARAISRAKLVIVEDQSARGNAATHDARLKLLRNRDGYALYRVRNSAPTP